MVKRKKAKKEVTKGIEALRAPAKTMPAAQFLLKVLAVFLSIILVIALTLYVTGRMPARGFWVLAAILAFIGFVILPWMRRKFSGGE
jgi:Na+/melibiose symporter-like transporter